MRRAAAYAAIGAATSVALVTSACSSTEQPAPATATTPAASLSTAAVTAYARTATRTALGDPLDLDVCAIAAGASLTGITGTKLVAPAQAGLASCELTAVPASTNTGRSGRIEVAVQPAPPAAGGVYATTPLVTSLQGRPLARHPFNRAQQSCPRVLTVARAGLATAYVRVTNFRGAGRTGSAAMCVINERIAARFVAFARVGSPPTIPAATPSLLGVNACRAAGAARLGRYVDATTTGATTTGAAAGATGTADAATAYGSGCGVTGSAGRLDVSTGVLRTAAARVTGSARTVADRRIYLQPDAAPQCSVAAPLGRLAVTVRFTSTTDSTPADCGPAARALVAYLGVLTRR